MVQFRKPKNCEPLQRVTESCDRAASAILRSWSIPAREAAGIPGRQDQAKQGGRQDEFRKGRPLSRPANWSHRSELAAEM